MEDYHSVNASDAGIVCWARAGGAEDVIPGVDQSGFNYYSYARDGFSLRTGEKIRVVTLAPSITETVAAIGGLDHVVGTDLYSNYPEEVIKWQEKGDISIVGGYTDPNYEWILKLDPDVVICDGDTGEHVSIANKLRKSGVDCVVLYDATDVEKLYDNIWITASAFGLSKNAHNAIEGAKETIGTVTGIVGIHSAERVFVFLGVEPSPWTSGSNTFMSDLISKAGGNNIFDGQKSSWFMVSKEQIYQKLNQLILQHPDVECCPPYWLDGFVKNIRQANGPTLCGFFIAVFGFAIAMVLLLDKQKNGPACRFSDADVFYTLDLLCRGGRFSRVSVGDHLGIGEGSVRRLVSILEDMGLVSVRQAGIGITSEGKMFLESLGMRTFEMDAGRYVIGEHSQGILVSGASEKVFNGIDQRDAGIRAGGDGCTTWVVTSGGIIMLPDWNVDDKDPGFAAALRISARPIDGDVLIIGGGNSRRLAMMASATAALELL